MKTGVIRNMRLDLLPCLVVALGLGAFSFFFMRDIEAFHASVDDWAMRDLASQTELAAHVIEELYATGDITGIQRFAREQRAKGFRVSLFGRTGKPIYDSHVAVLDDHRMRAEIAAARDKGYGAARRLSASTGENTLYAARAASGLLVRLAIPYDGLIEPVRRAHKNLLLAGVAGAGMLLFVYLFIRRLSRKSRDLARERDEKARQLAELEAREAFRRDFTANVTHEIKTPLTGILTACDMLRHDEMQPEARQTLLALVVREAQRLDALANAVLRLARIEHEAEAGHSVRTNFEARTLLESLEQRFLPRAEASGVALRLACPENARLSADFRHLEEALGILVDNALRHSGSDIIELGFADTGKERFFYVEDHGKGIAEADREHVFERFYRVEKDRNADSGGTGLGLACAKHLAQLCGGAIRLSPVEPTGCRFAFYV